MPHTFDDNTAAPSATELRDLVTAIREHAPEIHAEQVRLLYQGFQPGLFGIGANATILLIVLWPVTSLELLLGWILALVLLTTARFAIFLQYRKRRPDIIEARRWGRLFLVGVVLSAIVWGSTAIIMFPDDNITLQLFLVFVLMSISAGATTNLAYQRTTVFLFLLICQIPIIFRFFSIETSTTYGVGAIITVFLMHLIITANGIHRNSLKTIALQIQGRIRESVLSTTLQKQDIHLQRTPLGMIEWDTGFRVAEWNPAAERIFGYRRDEAIGRRASELIIPAALEPELNNVWRSLLQREGGFNNTNENITKDGRTITCEWYNTPLVKDDGSVVGVASMVLDISDRIRAEDALFQEKERAQITLYSIADAVMTTDAAGRIDYMNKTAEQLTGWRAEEAMGMPLMNVFRVVNEHTGQNADDPIALCLSAGKAIELHRHNNLIRRNQRIIPIEESAAPISDRNGNTIGVVLVFRDVSDERNLRQQLSYQASHDNLTGLTNRREFERRLIEALHHARQLNVEHALLYMDLDQFKIVNDTCGHIAGDELLRQLAMVLKSQMRTADTLARLGGDEFGVLLENCSLDVAEQIANKLRKTIKEFRFVWQEKVFEIGVSIGVASIDSTSEDSTSMLSAADIACYSAKEKGRNRVHIYKESDDEMAQRHGEMKYVSRIKQALDADRLVLYAQIIWPMGRVPQDEVHHEILVRMLGEDGELIAPGQFLSAAERYNLMPAIDRWIINSLFSQYHTLSYQGRVCKFSINLSGTSLNDDDFLDFLHGRFKKYQVPAQNITFEITETAAIANLTKAVHFIGEIKQIGCKFSLDDFGSGLSSFAYLKNLPVDFLKIDGSFIKDIVDDPTDWAMVEAITKIGHVMGLRTIAEFVETEAIRTELQKIGVDYAQGYLIGRPEPLSMLLPDAISGKPVQGSRQ